MRLKTLTARGIRGFNQKRTVEFASDLTLVYGKNGMGKTSLGEALEWLLYGKTAKRERGDSISKREYKDTYRNVHYEGADEPFVELHVYLPDGSDHTLRRQLNPDESSAAFLDGRPCLDFAALGLASEFDRPMILQHTLQDFIHMEPKKRYRALSSILGLEDLITFRGHVDTLQGMAGYAKDKPERARQARMFRDQLEESAKLHPNTGDFLNYLDAGPGSLPQARAALTALIAEALGREVPDQQVPGLLIAAKAEEEKAVFDWTRYSTPEPAESSQVIVESGLSDEANQAQGIFKKLTALPSDQELQRRRLLKQFYSIGLQLRTPTEPERCPFCDAPTLTGARVATIERQAEALVPCEEEHSALVQEYATFMRGLRARLPEARDILPDLPDKEARTKLQDILPSEAAERLRAFDSMFDPLGQQETRLTEARQLVLQALDHLQERTQGSLPDSDSSSELSKRITDFGERLKSAGSTARAYSATHKALTPAVQQSISTHEKVSYIDFLIRAWTRWSSIEVALYDIQLEASLLDFRRQVMAFIKKKQVEILDTREQDIRAWHDQLNPEEPVTFSGVQVVTDALRLTAESYGKTMEAAPNLSSSHLNCIGLAVYLACATRASAPFSFLFIDDPVQSMDEDHTEAFRMNVLQKLLNSHYQIIVLTHLQRFARGIDTRYRNLHELARLDFVSYAEDGPEIQAVLPEIQSYLKEAKDNTNATNDAYRTRSVECLRRFVERFIKDLYVRQTCNPISRRFQNARWSELKRLLRECKEFQPADETRLEDTHSFASQHLHEDDSAPQTVPKPHQIKPHVDDMAALLQEYKEKLGL